jgi:hypothetical protein
VSVGRSEVLVVLTWHGSGHCRACRRLRQHRGAEAQMNRRPPHEPARAFHPSHRLHDDASRHARWLGCRGCPDFKDCGGLHTEASIFDCNDLCSCEDRCASRKFRSECYRYSSRPQRLIFDHKVFHFIQSAQLRSILLWFDRAAVARASAAT